MLRILIGLIFLSISSASPLMASAQDKAFYEKQVALDAAFRVFVEKQFTGFKIKATKESLSAGQSNLAKASKSIDKSLKNLKSLPDQDSSELKKLSKTSQGLKLKKISEADLDTLLKMAAQVQDPEEMGRVGIIFGRALSQKQNKNMILPLMKKIKSFYKGDSDLIIADFFRGLSHASEPSTDAENLKVLWEWLKSQRDTVVYVDGMIYIVRTANTPRDVLTEIWDEAQQRYIVTKYPNLSWWMKIWKKIMGENTRYLPINTEYFRSLSNISDHRNMDPALVKKVLNLRSLLDPDMLDVFDDQFVNSPHIPQNVLKEIFERTKSKGVKGLGNLGMIARGKAISPEMLTEIYEISKGTFEGREPLYINLSIDNIHSQLVSNSATPPQIIREIFKNKKKISVDKWKGLVKSAVRNKNLPQDLRAEVLEMINSYSEKDWSNYDPETAKKAAKRFKERLLKQFNAS